MNLSVDIRSKFSVFLFVEDLDQATDLRGHLAVMGYEVFMFRDQDTVIDRVKEAAPHVLVFEIEALQTPLSEFVEKVLEANPDVQFLPMVTASQVLALSEYREHNFAGLVTKGEERDLRLLWQVDQVCSELYFQYQNEQLLDQKQELEKKLSARDAELQSLEQTRRRFEAAEPFRASHEIQNALRAKSREELVDLFLKQIQEKGLRQNRRVHALVLKFLPTVQSFVATQAVGLDLEKLKGIGARLEKDEVENLPALLEAGRIPLQLVQLLEQGLKIPKYVTRALVMGSVVEALFVFWSPDGEIRSEDSDDELSILQLAYQNMWLGQRLKELDTRDPITELEGRDVYFKKLDEEIARARRLQKAVSVVKVSIDHLDEIEQSFGLANRNSILRAVAQLIKRTSRVNDFTFRSDDNELTLVLPHCARKGAAIRAERIRRLIENHSFNLSGQRITLACGISEYPSLCASSEELEQTANQALSFIQDKGGNKVCLYRARQDFKPDFDVSPL